MTSANDSTPHSRQHSAGTFGSVEPPTLSVHGYGNKTDAPIQSDLMRLAVASFLRTTRTAHVPYEGHFVSASQGIHPFFLDLRRIRGESATNQFRPRVRSRVARWSSGVARRLRSSRHSSSSHSRREPAPRLARRGPVRADLSSHRAFFVLPHSGPNRSPGLLCHRILLFPCFEHIPILPPQAFRC